MDQVNKKKKIILHVGLHKTATSSVQYAAAIYRPLLERNKVFYPIFSFEEKKTYWNQNMPIFAAFSERPETHSILQSFFPDKTPKEIKDIMGKLMPAFMQPPADIVFLSAEDVCCMSENELKNLRNFLLEHTDDLSVYCGLRNPSTYEQAIQQQAIKNGGVQNNLYMMIDLETKVKAIKTAFDPYVHFFKFEDGTKHPKGFVPYFFDLIGLPDEVCQKVENHNMNESSSLESLDLIHYINQLAPRYMNDGKLHPKRGYSDTEGLEKIPGQRYQLDLDLFGKKRGQITHDIAFLKDYLGVDYQLQEPKATSIHWSNESFSALLDCFDALHPPLKLMVVQYFKRYIEQNPTADRAKITDFLTAQAR